MTEFAAWRIPFGMSTAVAAMPRKFKPGLSWSAISQYSECSEKYWHARIARTPSGPKNSALVEGTCGHAALEHFYRAKLNSRVLSTDEVLKFLDDYWAAAIQLEDIKWDETPDFRLRQVRRAVESHLKLIAPTVEPMLIEQDWRIVLPECSHDVIGVCDVVATDLTVHDHKFTKRIPAQTKVDDAADWTFGGYGAQLTCYALARSEGAFGAVDNWADVPLHLNVSVWGGTAKQLSTTRNLEQIVWFRRTLVKIAKAITAQIYFPHPSNCSWCDYRSSCRGNI